MPTASAARGHYKPGGGRFARPPGLSSKNMSRSTPNLSGHTRIPGTLTPTRHFCGATVPGSYTFRARPMPSFNLHDAVSPSHARSQYRQQFGGKRPPYAVDGDVHHGIPFYPPSPHPESPEAIARLQRIRQARKLYKTPAMRKATAGSVDNLLKDTLPERQPCSAVRHYHPHSERMYNLSASVPMQLHQLHDSHEHGDGRASRKNRSKGPQHRHLGSGSSGDDLLEPLGRRAVSSEAFIDEEEFARDNLALTEGTQTDVALSVDSLNESERSDAAVGPGVGAFYVDAACGLEQSDLRDSTVDVSKNQLAGELSPSFTLHPEPSWTREHGAETFPTILETDRELQTTDTVDYSESETANAKAAHVRADLEELRQFGAGPHKSGRMQEPAIEEISARRIERTVPDGDLAACLKGLEPTGKDHRNEDDDTVTEPVTSSDSARSSILDSDSDHEGKAKEAEDGPRTMTADFADLRPVEKRRSSLLKVASGEDEGRDSGSEYFLLPGDQSMSSELASPRDGMLDSRVAEWHLKSIFYQSMPIDGGAESTAAGSEGIRVSAVQVSTTRVVRNPNARYEPPDLPLIVSSLTYPMRQLYPLPNSNHFLSGAGPDKAVAKGMHITDSCLVYENHRRKAEKDPLVWTVNDRRELLDGGMAERLGQSENRPPASKAVRDSSKKGTEGGAVKQPMPHAPKQLTKPSPKEPPRPIPKGPTRPSPKEPIRPIVQEQGKELHGAPDVIPRARSPLPPRAETQERAARPDHLNIVPNYPSVYLSAPESSKQPDQAVSSLSSSRPSVLEFWRQREEASMKRNALNTSVGHRF